MKRLKKILKRIEKVLNNEDGFWDILDKSTGIIVVVIILAMLAPKFVNSSNTKGQQFLNDVDNATITIEDNGSPTGVSTTMGD